MRRWWRREPMADVSLPASQVPIGVEADGVGVGGSLHPLTATASRAFNTGEPVYWTDGEAIPEPAGPVLKLPPEAFE